MMGVADKHGLFRSLLYKIADVVLGVFEGHLPFAERGTAASKRNRYAGAAGVAAGVWDAYISVSLDLYVCPLLVFLQRVCEDEIAFRENARQWQLVRLLDRVLVVFEPVLVEKLCRINANSASNSHNSFGSSSNAQCFADIGVTIRQLHVKLYAQAMSDSFSFHTISSLFPQLPPKALTCHRMISLKVYNANRLCNSLIRAFEKEGIEEVLRSGYDAAVREVKMKAEERENRREGAANNNSNSSSSSNYGGSVVTATASASAANGMMAERVYAVRHVCDGRGDVLRKIRRGAQQEQQQQRLRRPIANFEVRIIVLCTIWLSERLNSFSRLPYNQTMLNNNNNNNNNGNSNNGTNNEAVDQEHTKYATGDKRDRPIPFHMLLIVSQLLPTRLSAPLLHWGTSLQFNLRFLADMRNVFVLAVPLLIVYLLWMPLSR